MYSYTTEMDWARNNFLMYGKNPSFLEVSLKKGIFISKLNVLSGDWSWRQGKDPQGFWVCEQQTHEANITPNTQREHMGQAQLAASLDS